MSISADMLAAFVKVAETLSVSASAAELHVGKSVVSKRIAQLESALAATLFSRSTRRVALTPAGEAYLVHARRMLAELHGGEERLRELRSELSGLIRLTAPVSWGQRVLGRHLPGFLRLHPGVEIELHLADRVMDLAYERIDIALRWSPTAAADLHALPLAHVAWHLVAEPGYLARAGAPGGPDELVAHPCLCYWRESSDEQWTLRRGDRTARVQVRSRYHANHPDAVADAALAGLGIAMLPGYLCEPALAEGRLVPVLPDWRPVTKFGELITSLVPPERLRLPRNGALLAYLREALAAPGMPGPSA